MATLEMVPLRSTMPFTGRVTLRHALPSVRIDVPDELPIHRIDKGAAQLPRIATTPQVEDEPTEAALETTAGKGGEAR